MTERQNKQNPGLEHNVTKARSGDREALEAVIQAIRNDVYGLALRFLWHPQDAEDATQEILIRVITGLGSFRGNSGFRTWVYRIACNRLITLRKQRAEKGAMRFEEFAGDLAYQDPGGVQQSPPGSEELLLLEEVKIGCTLAMLLCLDREHRLAYVLGEVMELSHQEASQVLEVSPAAFRKRLSRSRDKIKTFMLARCGLVNADNACRCRNRVSLAIDRGRVNPDQLLFASSMEVARRFPAVLKKIRQLEATRRAAALYRSYSPPEPATSFVSWIRAVIDDPQAMDVEGVSGRE